MPAIPVCHICTEASESGKYTLLDDGRGLWFWFLFVLGIVLVLLLMVQSLIDGVWVFQVV